MKTIFIVLVGLGAGLSTIKAQDMTPVHDSLLPLTKARSAYHKYVNYDVIKVMPGFGGSPSLNGLRYSFQFQFLCPYPNLRETFPIALGLHMGKTRIAARGRRVDFTASQVTNLVKDPQYKVATQETGHIGLVILYIHRMRAFTLLTGPSVNFNVLRNSIRSTTRAGDIAMFKDGASIRKVSVPLHAQLSWSPRQFWSAGSFASFDLLPRFKSGNLNHIHQFMIGVSLAVII